MENNAADENHEYHYVCNFDGLNLLKIAKSNPEE